MNVSNQVVVEEISEVVIEDDGLFQGLGVEVTLKSPEDFLKVVETLTRIGIETRSEGEVPQNKLVQSCHLLHKRGRYAILHFKELFLLDGKNANFTVNDEMRRNTIVRLLQEWELIDVVRPDDMAVGFVALNKVRILTFAEKKDYILEQKYTVGNGKYRGNR